MSLAPPEHKKDDKCDVDDDDVPVSSTPLRKKSGEFAETLTSPRNLKEYREYDLPTDTDDSSVCQSSPSDGKSRPLADSQIVVFLTVKIVIADRKIVISDSKIVIFLTVK